MRIELQSKGIELTPGLRTYAERRVRFALSRYSAQIRQVQVRLADLNGPRGGMDQRCQIEVSLQKGDPIVINVQDFLAEVAIGRASRRAARMMREDRSRRLSRERRPNRRTDGAGAPALVPAESTWEDEGHWEAGETALATS